MEKALLVSRHLLNWHETIDRNLPWVGIRDPYKIWLSEVILQQTQIAQGLNYYIRFIKHYPSVCDLAEASEDEVLQLWQGLGYYSRARHLHTTAKHICSRLDGIFPSQSKELRKLKGIGPYTASAIASFAFGERTVVVDGNVYRFLSRYFGIDIPINSAAAYKFFYEHAFKCLADSDPALFNQAIMDFGSLVCKPKQASCGDCPFRTSCTAYGTQSVYDYPVKKKNKPRRKRFFAYFICSHGGNLLLQQRTKKDVWQKLYEPYLIEHSADANETELIKEFCKKFAVNPQDITHDKTTVSKLTHQEITLHFYKSELDISFHTLETHQSLVPSSQLRLYSMPQPVYQYFKEKSVI